MVARWLAEVVQVEAGESLKVAVRLAEEVEEEEGETRNEGGSNCDEVEEKVVVIVYFVG